MRRRREEKGFSAWHLVLIFLGAVAVCGVFFSLGYVVGYNHGPAKASAQTENVTPATDIPPVVNTPPGASAQSSSMTTESVPPTPAEPPVVRPRPLEQPVSEPNPRVEQEPAASSKSRAGARRKISAPAKVHTEPPPESVRKGRYAVQVIASRTKADAVTLIRLLEARRYHVFLVPPTGSRPGERLYRVQVGPFASRAQAERTLHKLEGDGFKPFIVH
ncbi:MAG TPA: SPOR domain-containing protein [Terriglobia bacterium]|nr:SPOR domain-containing protein [Terriglobia bacterium]